MAWWRRDPSLWARSPAHRYAQRILRDHEAILRTRCFSRTPSNTAQHQDPDNARRPEGMTDQEWTQLQRYRKWKRLLQEHPYKGLFGASEDMLKGKGLTDWEWVYKTFPKWMLQDMDPQQSVDQDKSNSSGRKYGDRSGTQPRAEERLSGERQSAFAPPAIRTTHYELDEFGVVSPSDLRRPRDGPYVKVVGKNEKRDLPTPDIKKSKTDSVAPEKIVLQPGLRQINAAGTQVPEVTKDVAKEASSRESTFIDTFFADEPKVYDRDLGNSKSWRQTALERRQAPDVVAKSKAGSLPTAKPKESATGVTSPPVRNTITIPSSQALVDNYPYPKPSSTQSSNAVQTKLEPTSRVVDWSVSRPSEITKNASTPNVDSTFAQTTLDKLRNLPEDDIDFLSADEIRAAMGRRNSGLRTSEKRDDRQKLETSYITAEPKALDDVVEGHVLNNYHVRRFKQEFERAQTVAEAPVQMESSIDRMRRWIEDGGTSLAKHFWQDPIEAGAPSEADLQFAKQMSGLGKGRRAREHISEDLETDLPMCKGLLDRLKDDENRVEHTVLLLKSPRRTVHGTEISKNLRTIRERRLRNTYERTEKQFESACQSLRDLDAETVQKATNAFKRRLGIASRVLHKNHTLTRMLTWGAQARLDEPDLERGKAELYSEILTRLATLRDTQLALARLMDHAIQTYGVSLKPADEALSRAASVIELEAAESITKEDDASSKTAGAKFLADTAAAARLTDEIQTQKSAMQGLSDDGYARAPKQTPRKIFEEKSPLAHSLFRPFNLQFENLGRKSDGEEAADKLQEAHQQKVGDRKLVQEVRNAYEDVYGPITVEHRQVSLAEEPTDNPKAFEMLKEDPFNVEATAVQENLSPVEATAASEAMETKPIVEEAVAPSASSLTHDTIVEDNPTAVPASEVAINIPQITSSASASDTSTETATDATSTTNLPTHYTILVHDPQTDTLSITTSSSAPPRDTSPALPIHEALSTLKAPAKFVAYITPGLEVVTAKRHMLVLRNALDETSSTRGFETIGAPPSADTTTETFYNQVNPIDGTSRLSPTGYSGVEQSREQLEKDFEERRQAAVATEAARSKKSKQQARDKEVPPRRRGAVGGVIKTAIWASAVCYIVGVSAELLR
ncbi:hypothetical protein C7974DRAFT_90425 [Boeremia exigua]|uniref:uncharacterized protein n=1 Tax=Boeremia exigua TaxID=749465 RepID=UPI001E8DD4CD|nr:uncharacterized protein C7974DRAFT_90425 [Boeremia exigua]KAH6612046.1 hypothetical protein C7974DRAFT_90425 [Boeremia exigua]